jgi:hypothetical protein
LSGSGHAALWAAGGLAVSGFHLLWSRSALPHGVAVFFYSLGLAAVFHMTFYNLLGVPLPRGLSWKILETLRLIPGS